MKKIILLIPVICFVLLSCSSQNQTKPSEKFTKEMAEDFAIPLFGDSAIYFAIFDSKAIEIGNKYVDLEKAESKNLVSIKYDGIFNNISFTDEGKKYLIRMEGSFAYIKLADKNLKDVQIKEINSDKVTVTYLFEPINKTPFYECAIGKTQEVYNKVEYTFIKTNSGWMVKGYTSY